MRHPVVEADIRSILAADLPWDVLDDKTVLVSGAGGFLPAFMVETLLCRNEHGGRTRVLGLVRSLEKAARRFAVYQGRRDLALIAGDVSALPMIPEHIDIVVHAASQASPKYYGSDPVGTLSANVIGTRSLLELARENGSEQFLFFSSGEVYGQVDDAHVPTRETDYGYMDPTQVRACYAESKRMGENMCISWAHQYGVPAKIVRPFHTYGPGMALDDGRVYADFVADIVAGRNIVMKSDGRASRAFCYLADATEGFFTVLLMGQAGQAYNVGNPAAEMSILELAETLTHLLPEKRLQVVRQETPQTAAYLASPIARNSPNIEKIRSLGWVPRTPISEGFLRTVRSFS